MSAVWERFRAEASGRRVLVFGLGLQGGGVETANTLVRAGAQVRATDSKSAEELRDSLNRLDPQVAVTIGDHTPEDIAWAEIIVKNPAVPYSHPLIELAQREGALVITETAWALRFIRDQAIGVTGTRGKTTTSHLIHAIIQHSGRPTVLCGNLPGKPTLSLLEQITPPTLVVVEISSFHLEAAHVLRVSPRWAVVTNISPDHLNRYASVEQYARVKGEIFAYQKPGDHAFYGVHHPWSDVLAHTIQPGVNIHTLTPEIFAAAAGYDTSLPGKHNRENIAFAAGVCLELGIDPTTVAAAIKHFNGVPFRLQEVGQANGLTFVNDTTATTPTALETALDAQTQPFILIAGGTTKHLPLPDSLLEKIRTRPAAVVWLSGSGTNEVLSALGQATAPTTDSLAEAVRTAVAQAKQAGAQTVLLSPGFASFELFRNEFDRGEQFNQIVQSLAQNL